MNHRNLSFPILLSSAFLLSLPLLSQAEPGVPSDPTNSTPAPAAPAVTAPAPSAPSAATTTPAASDLTYTVVTGDSLWSIAHKHGCTVKQLQKLNNLKPHALLHPGQVIKLPPASSQSPTTPPPAVKPDASIPQPKKPKHLKLYAQAQPVQDFDIPASTFASCPTPPETDEPSTVPTSSAPVAQLVSPQDLTASTASETATSATASPAPAAPEPTASTETTEVAESTPPPVAPAPSVSPTYTARTDEDESSRLANPEPARVVPSSKQFNRNSSANSFFSASADDSSNDWASRFLQQAQALSNVGIEYDEDWRPPGESHSWEMDCSNTSRYLYKVTAGIQLPRTASDQYYYLHLQNKAWDVPQDSNGYADCNYLRENLKPGDLLFWENTYRPERQPPITHVMVFLGTNDRGQWIMAGSQTSRGGVHNRRNGGPDIYVFDPTKPCGGYSTWLGFVHHQGRFCAFGRPLEADRSKLAVAEND